MDLFKDTYETHPAYKLMVTMIEQYTFDLYHDSNYNRQMSSTADLLFYQATALKKIEVIANNIWQFLIINANFSKAEAHDKVEEILNTYVRKVYPFEKAIIRYNNIGLKHNIGNYDDVKEAHIEMSSIKK